MTMPYGTRTRARHQDGWVEVRGKKQKKWCGNYYTWDQAGKRSHQRVDLGPKADKTKGEAEDALRVVIQRETKIVAPATGENTLEWFWTNRFVPMQTA
jgi:hypothetical protein